MSCDVELTKDGGPGLPAHRNILAAVSQRFDKLLKAENGGTEMVPVIDTRILTRVMDFIYEDQAVFEEEEYNDFTDALNFLKIDLVLTVTRQEAATSAVSDVHTDRPVPGTAPLSNWDSETENTRTR